MTLSPIACFLLGWITSAAVALGGSLIYDAVTKPRARAKTKDNRHV